ncbi:MAG: penicillin-binding protein [Cellvibrionales bacterium]|nr:MAG: penicillin-binding protein [Cellvibrionales bacterium]
MQRYVDDNLVSGLSAVILKGTDIVDVKTWGYMDIEAQTPMRDDAIFRAYSNTKIVTSAAVMILYDDGAFDLDDPVEKYIPQFKDLKVLKKGAQELDDTEALQTPPTIRHLLTHTAGFAYGLFMTNPVDKVYVDQRMMGMESTLTEMIDKLAKLPLLYQPGEEWQYSISIDILARLVEIWSGKSFYEFLKERIFVPLAMVDTGFDVPPENHHRLTTNYSPIDLNDPMVPGLKACPDIMIGSVLEPKSYHSGGGGLVTTIADYTTFIQMIINGGEWQGQRILSSQSVELMHANQLREGLKVKLPTWDMPNTVFGLGFAVKNSPAVGEPDSAIGEYHWGGMAGTHSWISPKAGVSALIFTQRAYGFWHPFSHEFKRLVYKVTA